MSKQEFIKALIEAQKEFPTIEKNKTGQVGMGKFQYADLAELYSKTKDALWKHGFTCNANIITYEDKRNVLSINLMHQSGKQCHHK